MNCSQSDRLWKTNEFNHSQSLDTNPCGTFQRALGATVPASFSKTDVTAYKPSDGEKKAVLLFKGGRDIHVGKILKVS